MTLAAVEQDTVVREAEERALVELVKSGRKAAFEPLMRRYNRRLFRIVRAIVGDDAEAEDAVQQAYLSAYANLAKFAGLSSFATWLTRIAVNEALARKRARLLRATLRTAPACDVPSWCLGRGDSGFGDSPEGRAAAHELCARLEEAIDALPENLRLPFVLREVEGLSVSETASCLALTNETTRVRVHRARERVQERLADLGWVEAVVREVFSFAGQRCHRIVAAVLSRLELTAARKEIVSDDVTNSAFGALKVVPTETE